eukprot:TRINITY_DN9283_c0_g1_i1.p1 TRINITY_DN9283_c0_g1~~TRINITY_DN9283_c0_g1_i1.p1  ORF type:complete len:277 (-),score=56.28 TRINITY_DN9283_c0_g1_i1:484-1314(-)
MQLLSLLTFSWLLGLSLSVRSTWWQPGVTNQTQVLEVLTRAPRAYDSFSTTYCICNDGATCKDWGAELDAFMTQIQQAGIKVVPMVVLNAMATLNNTHYAVLINQLADKAVAAGWSGMHLDMETGGQRDDEYKKFLEAFYSATHPHGIELGTFTHGFWHPERLLPIQLDYLIDMDTYEHPAYAQYWVQGYKEQALIGLEPTPADSGLKTQASVAAYFDSLVTLKCPRIGTWGSPGNLTDEYASWWYDGMSKFLAAASPEPSPSPSPQSRVRIPGLR